MDHGFSKFLLDHPGYFKSIVDYESYVYLYRLIEDLWEVTSFVRFNRSSIDEYESLHSKLSPIGQVCKKDTFGITIDEYTKLLLTVSKFSEYSSIESKLAFIHHCQNLDNFITNARINNLKFSLGMVSLALLKNSEEALTIYKLKSLFQEKNE